MSEITNDDAATLEETPLVDAGPRESGALKRLYRGQTRFDFVGKRKIWFTISAVIIVLGIVAIGVRGLNLGIDFKGGNSWQVEAHGVTVAQATTAVENAGLSQPTVQILGGRTLEVQADLNGLSRAQQAVVSNKVVNALASLAHTSPNQVSTSTVGPTWGGEVTSRALWALGIFFVAVVIYISFRFEPKMALAAFIAMVHDLLVTIGVYAIFGFQVTPDTVVAVLTILGYSLYDTVVVFDRVRDNARSFGASGRMTYSDMVNLSMNQTLARSINTSLVAILPVLAVLVVGAEILGATTLLNYGLALFVGLLSGAYSSIFIASPVLALLKEREQRWRAVRARLEARGGRSEVLSPVTAAAARSTGVQASSAPGTSSGVIRPGSASARIAAGAPLEGETPRPRKKKRR
jgi:preprotein translocase subunit SecF